MKRNWLAVVAAAVLMILSARPAHADALYDISIDTSSFSGPLTLFFQLTDGSPSVANTASISLLDFGGGGADGAALFEGDASGDAATGFLLGDTSFFNAVFQSFSAGATLTFRLALTTLFEDGGVPDTFAFSILPLETDDLADSFFTVELTGGTPSVSTFGATVTAVDEVNPVPEPATLTLMASAMAIAARSMIRRRERRA